MLALLVYSMTAVRSTRPRGLRCAALRPMSRFNRPIVSDECFEVAETIYVRDLRVSLLGCTLLESDYYEFEECPVDADQCHLCTFQGGFRVSMSRTKKDVNADADIV